MNKYLKILEKYSIYLVVFLVPLFFSSMFPNPYLISKLMILVFGVTLALMLLAIRTLVSGKLNFAVGEYGLPVTLVMTGYLVSAIIMTPNKMEAFFVPGTATIVLASGVLYFLTSKFNKKEKGALSMFLFASGVFVSLLVLLAKTNTLEKIPQLPDYVKSNIFTSLGGSLPAAIFLLSLLPLGIGLTIRSKEIVKKALMSVSLIILVLGLVVTIGNSMPGKDTSPLLIDFRTSWETSIDTIKASPAWGIGPGNYLTAFNRFRPISFNQHDYWNIKFGTANNFYLTLITETGLVGGFAILVLAMSLYRKTTKDIVELRTGNWKNINTEKLSLLILAISLLFFPASLSLIMLLMLLLSLSSEVKKVTINLSARAEVGASLVAVRLPAILVATPVIISLVILSVYATRAFKTEQKYMRALTEIAQNKGVEAYNTLIETINQNPIVDRYHITYSQINLALAGNLAAQEDLSEKDRANVAELIQQAIRDAKSAVSLNPQRAGNWENLARTYQSIIAFAEGADQFTVESYAQAVALDPMNPGLRIALGGTYYALGIYDSAIDVLQLATLTKPDLPNAHYNLAVAYREKGEIENAVAEMTTVLSLVDPDSDDYNTAKTDLENLENRLPVAGAEGTGDLVPPTPAEQPVIEPPLELPDGSEPPEGEIPEVTPEPSPTPTPEI